MSRTRVKTMGFTINDWQVITEALEVLEEERRLTAEDRLKEGEPSLHAAHLEVSERARQIRERIESGV